MKKQALLLVLLLLPGCPVGAPRAVTPRKPSHTELSDIEQMCVHLQKLHCAEGDAVYNDDLPGPIDVPNQSCSDFFKELQADGYDVNAACVVLAPSCEDIETYRLKNPQNCK